MRVSIYFQFLQYLRSELAVPMHSLEHAITIVGQDLHLLPIALWQCEFLTVEELNQACDWIAIAHSHNSPIRSSM